MILFLMGVETPIPPSAMDAAAPEGAPRRLSGWSSMEAGISDLSRIAEK